MRNHRELGHAPTIVLVLHWTAGIARHRWGENTPERHRWLHPLPQPVPIEERRRAARGARYRTLLRNGASRAIESQRQPRLLQATRVQRFGNRGRIRNRADGLARRTVRRQVL